MILTIWEPNLTITDSMIPHASVDILGCQLSHDLSLTQFPLGRYEGRGAGLAEYQGLRTLGGGSLLSPPKLILVLLLLLS